MMEKLKELIKLHCEEKWHESNYMLGVTNGLILALATLEGKEPIYIEKPKQWTHESSFVKFLKAYEIEIEDFESRLFEWEYEIGEDQPEDWIAGAFEWHDQPEDRGFWWNLHSEWIKICNNKKVYYGKEFPTVSKK
jgi:hypothetical protein